MKEQEPATYTKLFKALSKSKNNYIEELKEDKGYRVLAIELLTHSRFRISETLKLKKTDIHDDYILFRKQTSKMRSKGIKSKDVKVPITPIIQTIINDIKETDKKYPHLQFVPWLFPSPRINLEKLNDQPGYAQKPECRLKDISETTIATMPKKNIIYL